MQLFELLSFSAQYKLSFKRRNERWQVNAIKICSTAYRLMIVLMLNRHPSNLWFCLLSQHACSLHVSVIYM